MQDKLAAQLFASQVEIVFEKTVYNQTTPNNDFDSVFFAASRSAAVKQLVYKNYQYQVASREPLEIAPDVYFQITDLQEHEKTGATQRIVFRLYSDTLTMQDLHEFVVKCTQEYDSQRNDKLGKDMFYFDQVVVQDPRFDGKTLLFEKLRFVTSRTFDNVFFEEKETVRDRVNHFMHRKAWYTERGIPHSLGFMFYGLPGCGKTSVIKAIANITRRHIINIRLKEIKTNRQLKNLFYSEIVNVVNSETNVVVDHKIPAHQKLIVIEDIDVCSDLVKKREYKPLNVTPAGVTAADDDDKSVPTTQAVEKTDKAVKPLSRKPVEYDDAEEELAAYFAEAHIEEKREMEQERRDLEKNDHVTLDVLLNVLDGTLEVDNRMIIITTNHPEVIDPALIRPGRIDMIIEFKCATREIMKQMFESFYAEKFSAEQFAKIRDHKVTPAVVNQVLFKHFSRPADAIEELVTLSGKRNQYKKRGTKTADKADA